MIFVIGFIIGYIIGETFGFLKSLVVNRVELFNKLKFSHTELVKYLRDETSRKLKKYKIEQNYNDKDFMEYYNYVRNDFEKYSSNRYKFSKEAYLEFIEDCYLNGKDEKYITAARRYISAFIN